MYKIEEDNLKSLDPNPGGMWHHCMYSHLWWCVLISILKVLRFRLLSPRMGNMVLANFGFKESAGHKISKCSIISFCCKRQSATALACDYGYDRKCRKSQQMQHQTYQMFYICLELFPFLHLLLGSSTLAGSYFYYINCWFFHLSGVIGEFPTCVVECATLAVNTTFCWDFLHLGL